MKKKKTLRLVIDYVGIEVVWVDRILFKVCIFDYKYLKCTAM